jgi:hypothetical protein
MTRKYFSNDKIHAAIAGATGSSALYYFSNAWGLGVQRETIGYLTPWIAFLIGWIWVVIYQETFARFNRYRLKQACHRRMKEIEKLLVLENVREERQRRLRKEYDDCLELISRVSTDDLLRRAEFIGQN